MLFIPLFVALCVKLDPGTHKGMHSVWPKNWVRYLPRCWGQKAMGKRNLRPMLSSLWAERERERGSGPSPARQRQPADGLLVQR
jgi:hypothetical protein